MKNLIVIAVVFLLCGSSMAGEKISGSKPDAKKSVTIYDSRSNLKARIQNGTIYDKNWNVKGHIEGGRIYDRGWNSKGTIIRK